MIVQEMDGRLRLIRQQDHAQISGALAHVWRPASGGPLPYRLVWATGVHDAAWTELDRRPIRDPETGRPRDFHRLPLARKLGPYRRGIARIAELDPYAGLQVSRHYCSFLDGAGADTEDFLENERERRARLRRRLPERLRRDSLLDRELGYLKLFDTLSLYVCLAAPGLDDGTRPGWLVPGDRLETPAGRELSLRWRSETELVLEPGGLGAGAVLRVPYRELPGPPGSQEELEAGWREAETEHLEVRLASET